MTLEEAGRLLLKHGPCRIMVSEDTAVSPRRAEGVLLASVVFVRDDGWSLATPKKFEREAYAMWKGSWIGFARFPIKNVLPISRYKEPTWPKTGQTEKSK